MKFRVKEISNPNIKNRNISVLFVNNQIDIPSLKFLVFESKYGGRNNSIQGRTTHRGKAIEIMELYRHLDDMGITWACAEEYHIEQIKYGMLCWDGYEKVSESKFNYKPIKNNTMNRKLDTWFSFFNYMKKIGYRIKINMTIKKVPKFYYKNKLLSHISNNQNERNYVDSWAIKVRNSPTVYSYNAISKKEYNSFYNELEKIDIVYALIAELMVESGLRISAALEIVKKDFDGLFGYINGGKEDYQRVDIKYIAKGGDIKIATFPIRFLKKLHIKYISREYIRRRTVYVKNNLGSSEINKIFWFTTKGKKINYGNVMYAFKKASNIIGRKEKSITPHWMRHTFATWIVLDFYESQGINIVDVGITPNIQLLKILAKFLGHASEETVLIYIRVAILLTNFGGHYGSNFSPISLESFKKSSSAQYILEEIVKKKLKEEIPKNFDFLSYGLKTGLIIDDRGFSQKIDNNFEVTTSFINKMRNFAEDEFGFYYQEKLFNPLSYAISRGFLESK
ncbi:site-specific integrase [Arcobacter sp. F2176]|uniref:tyrosine-type recombinase/integrase n=1 Tax=Arcobacter sp. F2176 TaxID=2044511 RepID=UPI00100C12A9|nr:site-specific integrase [Arcobacter sp. F2176]RXJ79345.1 hypothetical protein CRU95_14500 [Arcobacter sp. F2176]